MKTGSVISVRVIGFLSLFMLLTLNGDNGRDLLDVTVEYIEAKTASIREES